MIKYKGITSNLLTDLSLELCSAVNLNYSEHMLLKFFQWIAHDLSTEKKVALICLLPVHLKPFCTETNFPKQTTTLSVSSHSLKKTNTIILAVLKKYMTEDTFHLICSYLPETVPQQSVSLPEKIFLVA
ncbi:hypothetical protein [Cytophaga aurantiaca]|uniref:hypothetical protein n=1 Tax=Cytophaga aurantiaca TaxID=29530 RepID=UPI00037ED12E|nr:hypothetical protein [Cytophaga aurantiaca]